MFACVQVLFLCHALVRLCFLRKHGITSDCGHSSLLCRELVLPKLFFSCDCCGCLCCQSVLFHFDLNGVEQLLYNGCNLDASCDICCLHIVCVRIDVHKHLLQNRLDLFDHLLPLRCVRFFHFNEQLLQDRLDLHIVQHPLHNRLDLFLSLCLLRYRLCSRSCFRCRRCLFWEQLKAQCTKVETFQILNGKRDAFEQALALSATLYTCLRAHLLYD